MARKRVRASVTLPDGKSMEQVQSSAQLAVLKLYGETYPGSAYSWIRATLDGELVVQHGDRQWSHAWTIDADGIVTVSPERTEVIERITYEPVSASITFEVFGAVKAGRKFDVRVIGTGEGANSEGGARWFVPATDDGIGSAKKVFGGARVHWHAAQGKFDHADKALSDWLGSAHDVGYLSDLRVDDDGLFASLNLDDDTPDFVREALVERRVGLSVEAAAERRPVVRDGKKYVELVNWRHPEGEAASVAIVSHPALRGEVLAVAASRKESSMNYEQALAVIASETSTAEDVAKARKVIASHKPAAAPVVTVRTGLDPADDPKVVLAAIQSERAKSSVETLVRAAKLPEAHADRVIASIGELIDLDPSLRGEKLTARVTAAIEAERKLMPAPTVNASGAKVEVGTSERDRAKVILDRMLFGVQQSDRQRAAMRVLAANEYGGKTLDQVEREMGLPVATFMGPRRAFAIISGTDPGLWRSGPTEERARIRASVGSTLLDDMYADRMHKVMLAYSRTSPYRSMIDQVARRINVSDFRNVDFVHRGIYGALPAVAKGAPYTALSTPTDRGHEFTVGKYGGTEETNWEDIVNDDQNAVASTPMMLVDTYWETQGRDIVDVFLASNLTSDAPDYDSGTAWCAAGRSNRGTTAFSEAEMYVVWKAMQKQTDFFSSKRLNLSPAYLLHPVDLAKAVNDVLKPGKTADPANDPGGNTTDYSFARSMDVKPLMVPHWSDATDHVYVTDPALFPTVVVAYLNGNAEPTIDVQDQRTVGSWFDRDAMIWKISGVWGRDLVRHEGAYLEEVA